jgi:hypothetical protein
MKLDICPFKPQKKTMEPLGYTLAGRVWRIFVENVDEERDFPNFYSRQDAIGYAKKVMENFNSRFVIGTVAPYKIEWYEQDLDKATGKWKQTGVVCIVEGQEVWKRK